MKALSIINHMRLELNHFNLDMDILPSFDRMINYILPNNVSLTPLAELFIKKLYHQKCNDVGRYYWNLPPETYPISDKTLYDYVKPTTDIQGSTEYPLALLEDTPDLKILMSDYFILESFGSDLDELIF